jgi:septal ring factor EnvC (AmiA/AmiB activator)
LQCLWGETDLFTEDRNGVPFGMSIAELTEQLRQRDKQIEEQAARIKEQAARIKELEKEIRELTESKS